MASFASVLHWIDEERLHDPGGWANTVVSQIGLTQDNPPATVDELTAFLDLFAEGVQREATKATLNQGQRVTKAGADARVEAIFAINEWVVGLAGDNGNGGGEIASVHFLGVRLLPFAFQLALRVRKPALIDQGGTALCGTVALLYSFGKQWPRALAQLGMDLFEEGRGWYQYTRIDPSQRTRTRFLPRQAKSRLCEADYVILASVRECAGVSNLGSGFNVANQTLTGGTICTMLQQAGYVDVVDRTFLDLGSALRDLASKGLNQSVYFENHQPNVTNPSSRTQKKLTLLRAQQDLQDGRFVLMMGHADIGKAAKAGRDRISQNVFTHNAVTKTDRRHWTAVRKLQVDENAGTVSLRVITWGGAYDGVINLSDFLGLYEGYVSAVP